MIYYRIKYDRTATESLINKAFKKMRNGLNLIKDTLLENIPPENSTIRFSTDQVDCSQVALSFKVTNEIDIYEMKNGDCYTIVSIELINSPVHQDLKQLTSWLTNEWIAEGKLVNN